jgi:nicotinamidase-related amidase
MKQTYSLPTAKPYAFTFDPNRTALVIIDVQKDFVDPAGFGSIQCGSPEIFAGVRTVVGKIKTALDSSRALGLHVVHTREGHRPDLSDLPASKKYRQVNNPIGHHCLGIGEQGPMGRLLVRGEEGHGIVEELAPLPGEIVIDKSGKGSFWATELHRKLMGRGITHLLFTGVTTEYIAPKIGCVSM